MNGKDFDMMIEKRHEANERQEMNEMSTIRPYMYATIGKNMDKKGISSLPYQNGNANRKGKSNSRYSTHLTGRNNFPIPTSLLTFSCPGQTPCHLKLAIPPRQAGIAHHQTYQLNYP